MPLYKRVLYILIVFLFILIITSFILYLTKYYTNNIFDNNWFSKLTSISTAFATIIGVLLLIVTFFYFIETRKMVSEVIKQSEPILSAKIIPYTINVNLLKFVLKNTGTSPAYNVSLSFDPDIPYVSSSLNELKMFQNMPFLDNGEVVEFFFASSFEYFKNKNCPKNSIVTIKYFISPQPKKKFMKTKKIILQLDERMGLLTIDLKNFDDLVKEIEELKHALLILLAERNKNDQ